MKLVVKGPMAVKELLRIINTLKPLLNFEDAYFTYDELTLTCLLKAKSNEGDVDNK